MAAGSYNVTVAAGGFAAWTANVTAGVLNQAPVAAVLQVAPVTSTIEVTPPPKELAAEQLKSEEKQRVLGVFPHFLVICKQRVAPLKTAGQESPRVQDPGGSGDTAGHRGRCGNPAGANRYPEFGQGAEGYAKRFGARYTSHISGVMIHHVIVRQPQPGVFYKDISALDASKLIGILVHEDKPWSARPGIMLVPSTFTG